MKTKKYKPQGEQNPKSYLKSKTFWAGVLITAIEALQSLQALPFLDAKEAHVLAGMLAVFIAVNRRFK